MRFNTILLVITLGYILATVFFLYRIYNSAGGDGLGPYIILLIFQGASFLLVGVLAVINNKRWLNQEFGRASKLLLLTYLVMPLLTYMMIQ